MDFSYQAILLDCFDTLIDCRLGQNRVLEQFPSLRKHENKIDEILQRREELELEMQAASYRRQEDILGDSLARAVQAVIQVELTPAERRAFGASQLGWPAYTEVKEALAEMAKKAPLVLLSNADAQTLRLCAHKHFGNPPFQLFISAEELQSYKPAALHWGAALGALNLEAQECLFLSSRLETSLQPASELGFAVVYLNRKKSKVPDQPALLAEIRDLNAFLKLWKE
ncbi:MAG: hypothetical protein DWQ01_14670 [Planctomycetota bacterium]|nr:MAG: hypothetical protein DWQ01_14670 [Planctomycetota bacterium]